MHETRARDRNRCRYYAVHNGRVPGVYTDWGIASAQVNGYGGSAHKSFPTREEAERYVLNGPDHYDQQFGQDNLNTPSHRRIIRSVT